MLQSAGSVRRFRTIEGIGFDQVGSRLLNSRGSIWFPWILKAPAANLPCLTLGCLLRVGQQVLWAIILHLAARLIKETESYLRFYGLFKGMPDHFLELISRSQPKHFAILVNLKYVKTKRHGSEVESIFLSE